MPKIQDYAVIGNGRTCALISKEGSMDWYCNPRFDSPSVFAALLDREGGSWKIGVVGANRVKRSYVENTNVLQTEIFSAEGGILLTDFMPVCTEEEKEKQLYPEQETIRIVECIEGAPEVEVCFAPRPGYAKKKVELKQRGQLGLRVEGRDLLTLHSTIPLEKGVAKVRMREKEKWAFSLTAHCRGPAILPLLDEESVARKLQLTVEWWETWCQKINYTGHGREEVIRSALALKLLSFSPSGAFVAAPTTSLPEKVGGDLNWDYRFCWLRDASFISRALFGLDHSREALAFIDWLLYLTRLSLRALCILYDVYGRVCKKETVLKQFKGYENSFPVRLGNGASKQFQLDIYGEVVNSLFLALKKGLRNTRVLRNDLKHFGKYICRNWQRPDNGIWEYRNNIRRHTYSILMCWVVLKRILEMQEEIKLSKRWVARFKETKEKIARTLRTACWNEEISSYVTSPGGNEVGVDLLHLAIHELEPAGSVRMQSTFKRIKEILQPRHGLFYRNEIALKKGEGVFSMCNYWVIEYIALGGGTLEEARQLFTHSIGFGNDVGLFSEEIDPANLDSLGNFPQAITHVGLINAALALLKREEQG